MFGLFGVFSFGAFGLLVRGIIVLAQYMNDHGAHLGQSGLHFGYRSGIALFSVGTSSNLQDFHPDNRDSLT